MRGKLLHFGDDFFKIEARRDVAISSRVQAARTVITLMYALYMDDLLTQNDSR